MTSAESPTLDLACELIRRESITPEDAGCQELMMSRLRDLGFRCTPLPFGDTLNFWAEYGKGGGADGPLFAFAGHTDVVPTGPVEDWDTAPFDPTIRDGILYGRGAADMKASLAAMITACERFLAECAEPSGRIGFLITSDEEGPATHGTVRVMEWLTENDIQIDYCLVGEPSSSDQLGDVIKNGRRGSLNGTIRVLGRQGHVAYPQNAENPIHAALGALQELSERSWDAGNEFFPPTSFQITNLHAGAGATNVIPGDMELWLNFRYSTEQSADGLKKAVEDCLRSKNVSFEVEWTLSGEPFITGSGELVEACRKAINEELGIDPHLSTTGGTSDGRFIAPYGVQVVEFGPINASIHQVNEHVKVDDLARLSNSYAGILRRIVG